MAFFTSLVDALPGILAGYEGIKGRDTKGQKRATGQMEAIQAAQLDPSNPLYQRLYNQERADMGYDLASTIAEVQRQNRKAVSMGRNPLLSSDRGGEAIFRALMSQQEAGGSQARANVLNRLSAAQSGAGQLYNAQGGLSDVDYQNRADRVVGVQSLADILSKYLNRNKEQQGTYVQTSQPMDLTDLIRSYYRMRS